MHAPVESECFIGMHLFLRESVVCPPFSLLVLGNTWGNVALSNARVDSAFTSDVFVRRRSIGWMGASKMQCH
jgi:hypothetical protein